MWKNGETTVHFRDTRRAGGAYLEIEKPYDCAGSAKIDHWVSRSSSVWTAPTHLPSSDCR